MVQILARKKLRDTLIKDLKVISQELHDNDMSIRVKHVYFRLFMVKIDNDDYYLLIKGSRSHIIIYTIVTVGSYLLYLL